MSLFSRRGSGRVAPVSRSTGELLTTFTDLTPEQLTVAAPPETGGLDASVVWNADPPRGHRVPGRGWAPVDAALGQRRPALKKRVIDLAQFCFAPRINPNAKCTGNG